MDLGLIAGEQIPKVSRRKGAVSGARAVVARLSEKAFVGGPLASAVARRPDRHRQEVDQTTPQANRPDKEHYPGSTAHSASLLSRQPILWKTKPTSMAPKATPHPNKRSPLKG